MRIISWLLCAIFMSFVTVQAADNTGVKPVEAEGMGTDVQSCRKDAFMNAIKRVVGSYTDGQTVVNNAELEEKVLEVSGGFVERYDDLLPPTRDKDGTFRCKLRVYVQAERLQNKIAHPAQRGTSMKDAAAEIVSKIENETQGVELLKRYLTGLEQKLLVVRVVDKDGNPVEPSAKPEIEAMPDGQIKCTWHLQVYFDLKAYYENVCPVLDKVFSVTGTEVSSSFVLNRKEVSKKETLIISPFRSLSAALRQIGSELNDDKKNDAIDTRVLLSVGRDENAAQERFKVFSYPAGRYTETMKELSKLTPVMKIRIVKSDRSPLVIDEITCGDSVRRLNTILTSLLCTKMYDSDLIWFSPRFAECNCFDQESLSNDIITLSYVKSFPSVQHIKSISHLEFEFEIIRLNGDFAPSKAELGVNR